MKKGIVKLPLPTSEKNSLCPLILQIPPCPMCASCSPCSSLTTTWPLTCSNRKCRAAPTRQQVGTTLRSTWSSSIQRARGSVGENTQPRKVLARAYRIRPMYSHVKSGLLRSLRLLQLSPGGGDCLSCAPGGQLKDPEGRADSQQLSASQLGHSCSWCPRSCLCSCKGPVPFCFTRYRLKTLYLN